MAKENGNYMFWSEEQVRRALSSQAPEDQPVIEEYGRLVEHYTRLALEAGTVEVVGHLQRIAAHEAIGQLHADLMAGGGQGRTLSVLPPNARVLEPFRVSTSPIPVNRMAV